MRATQTINAGAGRRGGISRSKPSEQDERIRSNVIKLAVDGALTAALLALWSVALTGLTLHEWLGAALISIVLAHLLFNWLWIVATTRRFWKMMRTCVRINYVLNAVLFVAMTTVLFSGLMISVIALPALGLRGQRNMFLVLVHILAGDVLIVIVGLHLALNWKWVITTLRQQLTPRRPTPARWTSPRGYPTPRDWRADALRIIARSPALLLVAAVIALALYALSRAPLAPELTRALNVPRDRYVGLLGGPLNALGVLPRLTPALPRFGFFGGRAPIFLMQGLIDVAKNVLAFGILVSAVALVRNFGRRISPP